MGCSESKQSNSTACKVESFVLRVMVVGAESCGKTSLIHRIIHGHSNIKTVPTQLVQASFKYYHGENPFMLQLWEIPDTLKDGQLSIYLQQELSAVVVVTDATDPRSFRSIGLWKSRLARLLSKGLKESTKSISLSNSLELPTFLITNKCDNDRAMIKESEVANSVDGFKLAAGYLASAQTGTNVDKCVQKILKICLENYSQNLREPKDI